MPDTLPNRPGSLSNRPKSGLAAWEATVGYIAAEHSPDAMLTVRAYPRGEDNLWAALLEWGRYQESVEDQESMPLVLQALWHVVEQSHMIFLKSSDSVRKPTGYNDFDYLDGDTRDALDRLTWVMRVVFKEDWLLVMIYHPSDQPDTRVQIRLIARDDTVHIGGRGATFKDAATQLYRNATPYFSGLKD